MLNIKFSYPKWWDDAWGGPIFLKETLNGEGKIGDYAFNVHSKGEDCDVWIVYDNHEGYLFDKAICHKGLCIFITGEVHDGWTYPQKFLDQFDIVITARRDVSHKNLIYGPHICTWHIKKDFDYLKNLPPLKKSKDLSSIISTAANTHLHKTRLEFVKYVRDSPDLNLDWYGKGVQELDDKWLGLAEYKYSIAIENSVHNNYFTEKIIDCFLSYTMPIYFGCPNILDFFPANSMLLIDPANKVESLRKIKEAIKDNYYEDNFESLLEARNLVLDKLSFFPSLIEKLNDIGLYESSNSSQKRVLYRNPMLDGKRTLKQKIYRSKEMIKLRLAGYK